VLYNGRGVYRHSTDIFKLFKHNEALAQEVFLKPFQLIDLSQIPDKILAQQAWLSILLMCLKHTMDREDVLHWIEPMMDNMRIVENEGGLELAKTSLNYLFDAAEVSDASQLVEMIHGHLSPELEKTVMTIAQAFEARGEARGTLQAKQEMIERLLQKKLIPIESIAEIAGVSIETLQALTKNKPVADLS